MSSARVRRPAVVASVAVLAMLAIVVFIAGCRGGTPIVVTGNAASAVVVPRLDLDAPGLLAEGAIWPHPGIPPRELPARERLGEGGLILEDGEALVLQVPGRLLGKARVELQTSSDGGTLRVFALWTLFDDLPRTRGRPAEFQGRLGTLLRTHPIAAAISPSAVPAAPVASSAFDRPDELENDPNGIGFLVTLESPRRGQLIVSHVRFDELLPDRPARHSVGAETRPAVPIATGTSRRFELAAATPGATVELALALPDRMVRNHAPLRATVTAEGSEEGAIERRFDEREAALPLRRFEDVTLHFPRGTSGPIAIDVRVESAVESGAPSAVLAALPRLLPRRERATPWNVLLLSLDTLRNDRLDDPRALTPELARFAAESIRFTRCYSPANFTVPAHASMMTGLQPLVHGAHRFGDRVTIRAWPNVAGRLTAAGAYAAAFSGGGFVDPAFGFDEHFDRYCTLDPLMSTQNPRFDAGPRRLAAQYNRELRAPISFTRVADWLADHADRRFFLFLHTYFAHDYWPSPERVRLLGGDPESRWPRPLDLPSSEFGRVAHDSPQLLWYRTLYDAAVNEADEALAPLFSRLRESGLLDTTVVVVTADHGEAFKEHGTLFHSTGLHEEVLHVPLLIHVPGLPAATIDAPVSLIDLAPTLLELAGAEPLPEIQGTSLVPLLRGAEPPERLLLAQDCPPAVVSSDGSRVEVNHSTLIGRRFKLVRTMMPSGPVDALYDLLADPTELRDVAGDPANAGELAAARASLERTLASMQQAADRARARREAAPMSDALNDDLHKLGYQ